MSGKTIPNPRRSLTGSRRKHALLLACCLFLFQVPKAQAQVFGYGIGGPAAVSGFFGSLTGFHVAGGGELLLARRAGGNAELGMLGNVSSVLQVVSVNGVVHLLSVPTSGGVSPFITGGYSRLSSGEGAFEAWNVGAGVDIWEKNHVGFRLDVRDHVRPDSRGTVQYLAFRVGVVVK